MTENFSFFLPCLLRQILTPSPPGKFFPWVGHLPPRHNIFKNSPHPSPTSRYNNSFRVYCFLNTKPQLSKSKEFNTKEMQVLLKRDFISYFFFSHQKNNKKASEPCVKFRPTTNNSLQRCLNPLSQNKLPLFLLPLLF